MSMLRCPKCGREMVIDEELAAAVLSRMGASKGGKARAAGMSAKKRSAAAQKAAKARWEKGKE